MAGVSYNPLIGVLTSRRVSASNPHQTLEVDVGWAGFESGQGMLALRVNSQAA